MAKEKTSGTKFREDGLDYDGTSPRAAAGGFTFGEPAGEYGGGDLDEALPSGERN